MRLGFGLSLGGAGKAGGLAPGLEGRFTASGSTSMLAIGAARVDAAASMAGQAAFGAIGAQFGDAALASAGVATLAGVGASTAASAMSSSGIATLVAVGQAFGTGTQEAVFSSSGVGAMAAVGQAFSITFGTPTYTRLSDGTQPAFDIPDTVATGFSGGTFTIFVATRLGASGTLTKSEIENGTGNAIDSFSVGPEAVIADLDSLSLDLSTSLTSGAIDFFFRHSNGVESLVGSVTGVTYDAVAPAYTSATIENASPSTLTLVLNKNSYIATGETLAIGDFTFGGTLASKLTGGSVVRTNATTYTFTLTSPAANGETGTIALSAGTIVGVDGEAVSFAAQNITNNVAAASGVTATFLSAFESADTGVGSFSMTVDMSSHAGGPVVIALAQFSQSTSDAGGITPGTLDGKSPTIVSGTQQALAQEVSCVFAVYPSGSYSASSTLNATTSQVAWNMGGGAWEHDGTTVALSVAAPGTVRTGTTFDDTISAGSAVLAVQMAKDGSDAGFTGALTKVGSVDIRIGEWITLGSLSNATGGSTTMAASGSTSVQTAGVSVEIS